MQSDRALTPPHSKPAATGLRDLTIARPEAGLAVVTLNRPKARNALSLGLIEDLAAAFAALGADDTVAAVVLAAEGSVFSAGHDLKELTSHRADSDGGHAFFTATMSRCADMMQAIVACPKPVIAAVGGMATAAGCQLVATCDLAIAGEHAAFATPGVNIGLFCSTPMVALSRNIPRKKAMEMLLLGETMTAHQAAEFGLVNRVVASNQVLAEAMAMARAIAAKSKMTVATGKAAFYRQIEMPLAEAYTYAAKVMIDNMMKADAAEGICAFVEKRPPVWKDA